MVNSNNLISEEHFEGEKVNENAPVEDCRYSKDRGQGRRYRF